MAELHNSNGSPAPDPQGRATGNHGKAELPFATQPIEAPFGTETLYRTELPLTSQDLIGQLIHDTHKRGEWSYIRVQLGHDGSSVLTAISPAEDIEAVTKALFAGRSGADVRLQSDLRPDDVQTLKDCSRPFEYQNVADFRSWDELRGDLVVDEAKVVEAFLARLPEAHAFRDLPADAQLNVLHVLVAAYTMSDERAARQLAGEYILSTGLPQKELNLLVGDDTIRQREASGFFERTSGVSLQAVDTADQLCYIISTSSPENRSALADAFVMALPEASLNAPEIIRNILQPLLDGDSPDFNPSLITEKIFRLNLHLNNN